jgi:transcription elongation factor
MTLRELLEAAASELPGIGSNVGPDGAITLSRGGRPFAVANADGASAEFALDPAVADAAARTPDVATSGRGAGWVTFSPTALDDHAADRAVAWLASAHRRAEPRN